MRKRILEILRNNCPDIDFEVSTTLMDDGIIDSVTMIEIITLICDEFEVEIPFEEFRADNFNSLDAIINLVEKYTN